MRLIRAGSELIEILMAKGFTAPEGLAVFLLAFKIGRRAAPKGEVAKAVRLANETYYAAFGAPPLATSARETEACAAGHEMVAALQEAGFSVYEAMLGMEFALQTGEYLEGGVELREQARLKAAEILEARG